MNSKAISVLAESGLSGLEAETALRNLLSTLAAQGPEVESTLGGLGLRVSEVDPSHERTVEIIRRLRDGGLDPEAACVLFGAEGGAAYKALAQRLERFEELEGVRPTA